jgi:hypothetical protein
VTPDCNIFSTAAQVGGFSGANVVNNQDGTITITIYNVAGTQSFFRYTLQNVPNNPLGPNGPMRNIYQKFEWTEPIPGGCN